MKRLALLLLLALTACGVRPSVPIEGGPPPREEFRPGDAAFVYLLNGVTLTRVRRPATQNTALELLVAGPTSDERAQGLTTEIPPDAGPITVSQNADGVTVRISSAVQELSPLAQSQLVCTAAIPDQEWSIRVTLTDPTGTLPPQQCPFMA